MRVEIEQPHGFMKDSEGKICLRFGNWHIGEHEVPDYVDQIVYVDGPNAHEKPLHKDYLT